MNANTNQRRTAALSAATGQTAISAWRKVDPGAVVATWGPQLPALVAAVTTAQIAAAGLAVATVAAGNLVVAAAFGGLASDGRSLARLLFSPAIGVLVALASGVKPARAMAGGAAALDMITRTQVTDANRVATGVAVTADPELVGYERVVHLPACGRCLVLAGRLYRWSDGFQRHPRCDCTMTPVTRDQHRSSRLDNHPRALFDRMTPAQQDSKLGIANAQAIRDGADISQVVNAQSGMATAGGLKVTTSGATRRGTAGKRLGGASRLMPESIYELASDRAEAVEMLRQHGYIL